MVDIVNLSGGEIMAGDVELVELLFGRVAAGASVLASPGPVIHEYGPNLRIGVGSSTMAAPSPVNEDGLSPAERLGLDAFRLRLSGDFKDEKTKRPYSDEGWGGDGRPQLHRDNQFMIRGAPFTPGPDDPGEAPEAKRLAGRVAVGIIIVSGPGPLAMSTAQRAKIVAEVQNGLSYLGGAAPAKDVTFVYDIQVAEIGTPDTQGPPPPGVDAYEFYEKPWRDAALAAIGQPAAGNGIRQYIRKIKTANAAQSAYCAFFTHYTLHHFAYCSGSYLTMHYANDGWGTENLDRVFAHETGHIFGAPDEYAEAACNCGGNWGFFGKPNLNCETCAPGGAVDCVMRKNSWSMCEMTPFHLGYTMNVA